VGSAGDGRVQGESVPVDGKGLGLGVFADEGFRSNGKRLLPGVGPDGNAVTHGSGIESVLYVRLGEIEVRMLGILNEHPVSFELVHRAANDAIEQGLHVGRCRGFDGMKSRCLVIEHVDTIQDDHVQVHVEIQSRPKSLDEGDDAGSGPALTSEPGTVNEMGLDGPGNDPKRS